MGVLVVPADLLLGVLELDVRGPGVALAFLLVLGPADHLPVLPVYPLRSGVGDPVRVQPGAGDLLAGLDVNRHFLHAGRPQGNQLVADNGFAALADAYAQETIDALAGAIYKIAVGVLPEITHPGQIQTLKAVRIGGVDDVRHILVAHQEESVAHNCDVRGVAGVIGGGGHIQVDAGHRGTVAQLGGVLAAHHLGAVRSAAVGAVDGVPEHGALGLVALGVDVCHVVSDDAQLLHVRLQAANGCVH